MDSLRLTPTICLLFFSALLFGQISPVWQSPVPVADSEFGYHGPRIMLRADGQPLVMWGRSSSAMDSIFVAVGDGMGGFAKPKGLPSAGIEPFVNSNEGPSMAVNGNDIYVAFGSLSYNHGFVVHSADGGETWGPAAQATGSGTQLSLISVAADRNGGAHVAYLDLSGFAPAYWYTNSADGISWTDPVPVNTSTPGIVCECCWADLLVSGDTVQIFFRNNEADLRDIRVVRSVDGGLTFPVQMDIDPTDWMIFGCPVAGPDAIVLGDSVYTVFMSGATSPAQVYLASLDSDNWVYGQTRLISPRLSRVQKVPRLAGSGTALGAVWTETGGFPSKGRVLISQDGANGLKGTTFALGDTTRMLNVPDIAYADGVFHVVYEQDNQVWYQRSDATSGLGEEITSLPGLTLYPQPAINDRQLVHWPDAPGEWKAQWLSLDGRMGKMVSLSGPGPHELMGGEGLGGWLFTTGDQSTWRPVVSGL